MFFTEPIASRESFTLSRNHAVIFLFFSSMACERFQISSRELDTVLERGAENMVAFTSRINTISVGRETTNQVVRPSFCIPEGLSAVNRSGMERPEFATFDERMVSPGQDLRGGN